MRFPPALLDDIRARLPVSQVVGRKVQLKKAGREWKGLSPFKSERTPSFFVNDQKGFYHCFATGEHGDIFTFLMKTEGLSFPEAIERLAEEAGVPLPKPEARDQKREDERQRLYSLMEASAAFFEQTYKGPAAEHARKYVVEKRGLTPLAIGTFRLGYAPDSRNALKQHLAKLGYTNEEMIASGMLIGGADIPVSYDRFRNRVMFPITDLKGRVIAFGGRALDADAPAKYLNSPETPLFHKGHVLFNAGRARGIAHKTNRIIVVEGYMDVVALASAGFGESVAPLGTALTEDQVKLLWRFAPEPTLCFDGDGAGRKAAFRAIDIALPHLEPGRSLRFAFLPDGLDPDDLVRQQGREAMEQVLAQTRSLSDVLFDREWGAGDWSTPERRAQLEQQLVGLVGRIGNEQVRGFYAHDVRERIGRAFGRTTTFPTIVPPPVPNESRGSTARSHGGWRGPASRSPFQPGQLGRQPARRFGPPALLDSPLAASDSLKSALQSETGVPRREAVMLRTLVNHPWLIEERWEDISSLDLSAGVARRLRDAVLEHYAAGGALDSDPLRIHLRQSGFEKSLELIEQAGLDRAERFVDPGAERMEVEQGWRHLVAMHTSRETFDRQLRDAQADWEREQTEDAWTRIVELKRLQDLRLDMDDAVQGATG